MSQDTLVASQPNSPHFPALAEFSGPWLYKTQVLQRYDITRSELEIAILPCEIGPNKYRPGLYWKFNEPDVLKLEMCLRQGLGIEIPSESTGDYQQDGFAEQNGATINGRDAMYQYNLTTFQLERIKPIKGFSNHRNKETVWSYNLCDVKALERQPHNLAKVLCPPSLTVTTDGKGTFYGRKTLAWILNHGSPEEQTNALGELSAAACRSPIDEPSGNPTPPVAHGDFKFLVAQLTRGNIVWAFLILCIAYLAF